MTVLESMIWEGSESVCMAGKGGDPTMAAAESQQIQPVALYDLLLCCVISQVQQWAKCTRRALLISWRYNI